MRNSPHKGIAELTHHALHCPAVNMGVDSTQIAKRLCQSAIYCFEDECLSQCAIYPFTCHCQAKFERHIKAWGSREWAVQLDPR